jgi:hypothetical protein
LTRPTPITAAEWAFALIAVIACCPSLAASVSGTMREKSNFPNPFKLICAVQSLAKKESAS